jgi:hypothetical protein
MSKTIEGGKKQSVTHCLLAFFAFVASPRRVRCAGRNARNRTVLFDDLNHAYIVRCDLMSNVK